MTEPLSPQNKPYASEIETGKTYYWCACGLSKSQPFCDGSHQGTTFEPVKFVAEDKVMVAFCGCKQSQCKPFCDDTHIAIVEEPKDDEYGTEGERII